MKIISLWLDHQKFGCGWRDYAAIEGRKWVKLVMLATGESATIPMAEYVSALRHSRPVRERGATKRLRRNAKTFGTFDSVSVKTALSEMRA